MTEGDLKKLREIADAATPGPWEVDDTNGRATIEDADGYAVAHPAEFANIRTMQSHGHENNLANARFIAAARNAVPALIVMVQQLSEQVDAIPTLLTENARLTKAVAEAPKFLEAVKIATSAENAQLCAALHEALDIFDATWCPEHGHAPKPNQHARVAELRKLVPL